MKNKNTKVKGEFIMNNKRKCRNWEYCLAQILIIIASFKGFDPSQINLFFDMDNTLFIFSKDGRDDLSLIAQQFKGFFENLEPYPEGPRVLKKLIEMGFNVYILSSCMTNEYCRPEKRESLRKHFPFLKDEQIIFVNNGENKAQKIKEMGIDISKSILVDDYCVNLQAWMDEGGLAIKKTYSGKERLIPQVKNLNEIFGILEDVL